MSSKPKRACIFSGNGSWSMYGAATLARFNRNYDTVIGTSTGGMLSPFIALREWEYLKIKFSSISNRNFYDKRFLKPRPVDKNGKINTWAVILTLIFKQETIITTKNFRKYIDEFFTKEYYDEIQKQSKEVLIGVQNYSQIPSKTYFQNSLYENHKDLKDWMWVSANTPFLSSLTKKSWNDEQGNFHVGRWGDGNLTDLLALKYFLGERYTNIDIIFNRERTIEKFEGNKITNLVDYVITSYSSMKENIEREYFYDVVETLNKEGTNINIYWIPRKLHTPPTSFKTEQMLNWWEEGYVTAEDENRVDSFPRLSKW